MGEKLSPIVRNKLFLGEIPSTLLTMDRKHTGIVIVIPTRNRASYATRAIRSALVDDSRVMNVLVSDNSTKEKEACDLYHYCSQIRDRRVRYIAPPKPMAISDHWEWAILQALGLYDSSHFVFLSDRNIFMPGGLQDAAGISELYQDRVISYSNNIIDDTGYPVYLLQRDWTGKVYELESAHLFYLASRLKTHICFPLMMNCVVPREVLFQIQRIFGKIFDSLSPDYYFAFRCLDVVGSIMYFDKPVHLAYGLDKSSGWSHTTGIPNDAILDYFSYIEGEFKYFDAPVPGLVISANAKVHEYCRFLKQRNSCKYPNLNEEEYIKAMEAAINKIQNVRLQKEQKNILRNYIEEKFSNTCEDIERIELLPSRTRKSIRKRAHFLRKNGFKSVWHLMSLLVGIYPSGFTLEFDDREKAINHAERFPRKRRSDDRSLIEDLELPNLGPIRDEI